MSTGLLVRGDIPACTVPTSSPNVECGVKLDDAVIVIISRSRYPTLHTRRAPPHYLERVVSDLHIVSVVYQILQYITTLMIY
eukprot:8479326-Pyramimonas_sp.AAC.2